jgi:hypothetical protein
MHVSPWSRCCRLIGILLLGTGLAGCGSRDAATYPVIGKVTFDNNVPLATGGLVMFQSVAGGNQPQVTAAGTIGPDGTFRLSTHKDGDGAVSGKHRVLVRAKRGVSPRGDLGTRPPSPVDPRFESFDTSGLEFTVGEGPNDFKIVVKRP